MIDLIDRFVEKYSIQYVFQKRHFEYAILSLTLLLGIYLSWSTEATLLLVFLVWDIMNPFSSSTLANILSYLLILIPLILFVHRPEVADMYSIGAFTLIVLLLIRLLLEKKRTTLEDE